MKIRASLVTISLALVSLAVAGNFDLEFHAVPRRSDETTKRAGDGGTNRTDEHWVYDLTVENRTFKELTNLEVKYAVFYTHEELGVKAAATSEKQTGSFSIDSLKSHEKKLITTNPVELKKSNLVGNWTYTSGAKPNAADRLVGVAVRVIQNGQMFAEFANPSSLSREKWE